VFFFFFFFKSKLDHLCTCGFIKQEKLTHTPITCRIKQDLAMLSATYNIRGFHLPTSTAFINRRALNIQHTHNSFKQSLTHTHTSFMQSTNSGVFFLQVQLVLFYLAFFMYIILYIYIYISCLVASKIEDFFFFFFTIIVPLFC
jgi:hypothetical protein